MPHQLPDKRPHARAKAAQPEQGTDWLGIWALSMAFAAVVLAAIAYFSIGDKIGASLILFSAAALVATVMHFGAVGKNERD
jgi:hypothetical protein